MLIANWKNKGNHEQVIKWLSKLADYIENSSLGSKEWLGNFPQIVLCPPDILIDDTYKAIQSNKNLHSRQINILNNVVPILAIGKQNFREHDQKTHYSYCIIGHSDHDRNEDKSYRRLSNHEYQRRILNAFKQNIKPIICIGSEKEINSKEECQSFVDSYGEIFDVMNRTKDQEDIIIAYEPVSSIGSAEAASDSCIARVMENMKIKIKQTIQNKTIVLAYGGSVKQENSKNILTQIKNAIHSQEDDLDSKNKVVQGLMLGRSGVESESFLQILSSFKFMREQ